MSTTAVPQALVQYVPIQTEVSALAHKHITLSYAILAVLVLALVVGCLGGYVGLRGYERALARAEAAEQRFEQKDQQYQQMFQSFQQQLAKDSADRDAATQREQALQAQIAARASQPLSPAVQTGLKPDATAQEAAIALQTALPALGALEATPEGKVLSTVTQTQAEAISIMAGNKAGADLKDTQSILGLEQSKTQSLTTDLNSCKSTLSESQTTLADAQKTITAYKKAAVKSRWQRVWGGIKTYGGFFLGVAVGRKL